MYIRVCRSLVGYVANVTSRRASEVSTQLNRITINIPCYAKINLSHYLYSQEHV